VKRIAIDTNVVDVIADTPGLLEAIVEAGASGRLVIIANHILRDELLATSDPDRKARLITVYEALRQVDGVCPLCDVALGGVNWTCPGCERTYHEPCFWRGVPLEEWKDLISRLMAAEDAGAVVSESVCAACRQGGA
jgi:predicted Fe-S protein YdhL (DUF1289 family)